MFRLDGERLEKARLPDACLTFHEHHRGDAAARLLQRAEKVADFAVPSDRGADDTHVAHPTGRCGSRSMGSGSASLAGTQRF